MTTFKLDPKLCPQIYYVKSEMDSTGRSIYRLKFLENQIIQLHGEDDTFTKVDESWNINANKENRNDHPLGTVFKLKKCVLLQSPKKQWATCADRKYLEVINETEATALINDEMSRIMSEEEESKAPVDISDEELDAMKSTSTPAAEDNFLGKLLKDHPVPNLKKTGFYISKKLWKELIRHMARRKNILLMGDSGIGKTEIVAFLAESFSKPLHVHDMGATQDPIASLIGVHRIGKDGTSVFDVAKFVDDISGPNVVLFDEINRAPLNSNNILFPLTDRRRELDMSIASSEMARKVKAHDETVFVATANIGSQFTGTNTLDEAFQSRFFPVQIEYPPQKQEVELLVVRTGVDPKAAVDIVKIADRTRAKRQNNTISNNISIRQTLEIAELVADGFKVEEAVELYIKPTFGDEYSEVKDIIHAL
ncbi:MAG: MoxR family ATPase [Bacteroidales bacterium]|jgi:MoxR-like ATPase|nr:MoxR family ATPase [Bacteroidales bacterium]